MRWAASTRLLAVSCSLVAALRPLITHLSAPFTDSLTRIVIYVLVLCLIACAVYSCSAGLTGLHTTTTPAISPPISSRKGYLRCVHSIHTFVCASKAFVASFEQELGASATKHQSKMQTQSRAAAGWRSKLTDSMNTVAVPKRINIGAGPQGGHKPASTTTAAVANPDLAATAEAIRRSPLGLDLPSDHPGLALVAQSLVRPSNSPSYRVDRAGRNHALPQ